MGSARLATIIANVHQSNMAATAVHPELPERCNQADILNLDLIPLLRTAVNS